MKNDGPIAQDFSRPRTASPHNLAWWEIIRRGIGEGIRFTDAEIYQMFIDHTPANKVSDVEQVFVRFHGGDFLE